jgi:hypothetical protein
MSRRAPSPSDQAQRRPAGNDLTNSAQRSSLRYGLAVAFHFLQLQIIRN